MKDLITVHNPMHKEKRLYFLHRFHSAQCEPRKAKMNMDVEYVRSSISTKSQPSSMSVESIYH